MEPTDENKAVVRRFLEEFYRKGNLDIFDELLSPDFFFMGVGGEVQGDIQRLKEIAATTHELIQTAVPDFTFEIDELSAERNSVSGRFNERGTMNGPYVIGPTRIEPTGKSFSLTTIEVFHLQDGLIEERWATRDRLGFLQQVGAPVSIG